MGSYSIRLKRSIEKDICRLPRSQVLGVLSATEELGLSEVG
jgi:hypothetical protein